MKELTDEQIKGVFRANGWVHSSIAMKQARAAIAADRALNGITGEAQPAEQANGQEAANHEPSISCNHGKDQHCSNCYTTTPPAQPAREWVGLTDEEIVNKAMFLSGLGTRPDVLDFARAIESALREKNAGQPAADDKAGREPVAWANSANLASASVSRQRGGPFDTHTWSEGKTACHDTALYTRPQPQAEVVSPDKAKNFYLAVCNFLVWIGREGTVHADDPIIDQLSNALHDIDGGVFKDSLKWPQAEVRVPEGYALVPESALRWLFGEEGSFECPPDKYFRGKPPTYWWRGVFRDMLAAAPKPQEGGAA